MSLLIVDDAYPYQVSGFRLTEFNYLLEVFPGASVLSTLHVLDWLGHDASKTSVLADFNSLFPTLGPRVIFSSQDSLGIALSEFLRSKKYNRPTLLYSLFLNNAYEICEISEKWGIDFAFTLYPGGGFAHKNMASQKKLSRVLSSPRCKAVISTMPLTKQVVDKALKDLGNFQTRHLYLYGGVLQRPNAAGFRRLKSSSDHTTRLLFIANRYHPKGIDKGLDLFLASASSLVDKGLDIASVLVGPWTQNDLDGFSCAENTELLGLLDNRELHKVFEKSDIAIFPNRKSILSPGSYDGFPVGTAVEAALHGVPTLMTNPMRMQTPLRPGIDYVEVPGNHRKITKKLLELIENPEKLQRIGEEGQKAFTEVFAPENQLSPRVKLLEYLLP